MFVVSYVKTKTVDSINGRIVQLVVEKDTDVVAFLEGCHHTQVTLWRDSVVKISKDAVKVVKSSNNKGSKMVVTSSKNVVRIFFAFTTLTATKKAYRIYGKFWKDLEFPPYFLGSFYYFLLLFTAKLENIGSKKFGSKIVVKMK